METVIKSIKKNTDFILNTSVFKRDKKKRTILFVRLTLLGCCQKSRQAAAPNNTSDKKSKTPLRNRSRKKVTVLLTRASNNILKSIPRSFPWALMRLFYIRVNLLCLWIIAQCCCLCSRDSAFRLTGVDQVHDPTCQITGEKVKRDFKQFPKQI